MATRRDKKKDLPSTMTEIHVSFEEVSGSLPVCLVFQIQLSLTVSP